MDTSQPCMICRRFDPTTRCPAVLEHGGSSPLLPQASPKQLFNALTLLGRHGSIPRCTGWPCHVPPGRPRGCTTDPCVLHASSQIMCRSAGYMLL